MARHRDRMPSSGTLGGLHTAAGNPTAQVTILAGSLTGRRYVVETSLSIGRAADTDLALDDPEASRRHARIERAADGRFVAVDLGSRNGTFVNGVRIEREHLVFGDKVQVGSTSMLFTAYDEHEEERIQRHRFETLGRLCAGVVHDLNNALCVVSASAAYLRDQGAAGPSEQAECLEDIQAASDRATQLSRQLVAFARGSGEGPARVDVAALCTEAMKFARRTLPQSIQIRSHLQPGLFAHAESAQLHQILMNLCVNARDAILAADRPGSIRVESRRGSLEPRPGQAGALVIAVHDDGAGMDERAKARLFEPFFTTKSESGGFGMGLSTVAELVTRMGGHIRVESELGAGSVFSVELPLAEEAPSGVRAAGATTGTPVRGRAGHGERVLVIDDDASVRRSIARVLRHAGFTVHQAEDGVQGLAAVRGSAAPIDVVLLDLDMPKMGGEELLGRLKPLFPRLPVIVLSGHIGPETLARVRARGAQALIAKPCGSAELLACIGEALDRTEALAAFEERTAISQPR